MILALAACDATALAENLHEQTHRSIPAAHVTRVTVENVSGSIVVKGGGNAVVIDATKNGANEGDLARTHVDITTGGGEVAVKTNYDRDNTWFGNHNGGSVDYRITVPPSVALEITNVSGSVTIAGVSGDVRATAVSGSIDAVLGRVAGSRYVKLGTVSGPIAASIARNSDVRISSKTLSGGIREFAEGSVDKGYVGENATARLGSGAASMNLSTISGSITISPL